MLENKKIPQILCKILRNFKKNLKNSRFEDTIMGQFYGDVHVDLFRLFYEDMNDHRSRPIGVQFASPSVSSFTEMNPAYRVWTADPVSFRLLDYETWSMDLGDVRNVPQKCPAPKWQLLYRAREAYGLKDMSPDSWNRLLGRIQNEKEMTMLFYKCVPFEVELFRILILTSECLQKAFLFTKFYEF